MERREIPAPVTEVPFMDQIKDTWEPFQDNWLIATGSAAILSYVPMIVVGIPACIIAFIIAFIVGMANKDMVMICLIPVGIVSGLAFAAAYNALRAGWTKMLLDQARGETISFQDLKSGMPWFVDFFLALLLIGVGTTIGGFLFVIPGIFFAVRTSFAPFLIIDQNLGCIEALKKSNEMVTGYSWQILGYYGIMFFANLVIGFIPLLPIVLAPAAMGFFDMLLARLYLSRKEAASAISQRY